MKKESRFKQFAKTLRNTLAIVLIIVAILVAVKFLAGLLIEFLFWLTDLLRPSY